MTLYDTKRREWLWDYYASIKYKQTVNPKKPLYFYVEKRQKKGRAEHWRFTGFITAFNKKDALKILNVIKTANGSSNYRLFGYAFRAGK